MLFTVCWECAFGTCCVSSHSLRFRNCTPWHALPSHGYGVKELHSTLQHCRLDNASQHCQSNSTATTSVQHAYLTCCAVCYAAPAGLRWWRQTTVSSGRPWRPSWPPCRRSPPLPSRPQRLAMRWQRCRPCCWRKTMMPQTTTSTETGMLTWSELQLLAVC